MAMCVGHARSAYRKGQLASARPAKERYRTILEISDCEKCRNRVNFPPLVPSPFFPPSASMSDTSAPEKNAPRAIRKPNRSHRRRWIAGGLVAFLCVAIGVGVGVGVGVGTKKHKSPEKSANASAGETSANGTTTAEEISREALLGDQGRWLGSSRQFPVSAAPTTREFNWTVSAVSAAPGGMTKPIIVVNGVSPSSSGEHLLMADLPRPHPRGERGRPPPDSRAQCAPERDVYSLARAAPPRPRVHGRHARHHAVRHPPWV